MAVKTRYRETLGAEEYYETLRDMSWMSEPCGVVKTPRDENKIQDVVAYLQIEIANITKAGPK